MGAARAARGRGFGPQAGGCTASGRGVHVRAATLEKLLAGGRAAMGLRVQRPCPAGPRPRPRRLLQEFVELVRCGQQLEAIAYARRHLAPWAGQYMPELQRAAALLAFQAGTQCGPYQQLFEEERVRVHGCMGAWVRAGAACRLAWGPVPSAS